MSKATLEGDVGIPISDQLPDPPDTVMWTMRRLWPYDLARLRDHLLRLDAEDRALRFSAYLGDAAIARYCDEMHWLDCLRLGAFADGELRGAAELCRIGPPGSRRAELAITVDRLWRDQGIGGALFGRLATLARNRGVERLHMICLLENRRIQAIAAKHEAVFEACDGQVEGWVDLRPGNPGTLAEELVGEGVGFLRALRRRSMTLRPMPA